MEIYFDNSATTPIHPDILEYLKLHLSQYYGNPSSIHKQGLLANEEVQVARHKVAQLLNVNSDEIYFTNSGTFANNLSLLGRARFIDANNLGRHIITSTIEHPSVLNVIKYLEGKNFSVTYIRPSKNGIISCDDVFDNLTDETSIVSLMWANNEIGSIQPINEIAKVLNAKNIFFHCDAIQVPGKLAIDLQSIPVSTLSISGHKFHGPKGIGALFIHKGINIMPITFGGGQESGLNPGTHAVDSIITMGLASELAHKNLNDNESHLRRLQSFLLNELDNHPQIQITGPSDINSRLPGHISFATNVIEAEALVNLASLQGLYLSSGSACKAGIKEPSYVIKSLGLSNDYASGAIRISLSQFNSIDECEVAIKILKKILQKK